MQYRTFGRTGIKVSEIGYGAWGIGGALWQGNDDAEAMRALHKSADLGVNFYDTALVYGDGHSESLVGKFFKERKERFYVASKVPPKNGRWPSPKGCPLRDVFPLKYIIECTEKSLRHLKLDTIDIQQLHVWNDEWTNDNEWRDAIAKLKEDGKITFFGVSINDRQPANAMELINSGLVDTVQVIYNILEQAPEDKLFPACIEKNIGVIARVPLDEGGLTGNVTPDSTFPEGDFRNWYFSGDKKQQTYDRAMKLKFLLGKEADTLPELALRFCLHHPAVSTVIPGMRTVPHAELNCSYSDGRTLSKELIAELRKHRWDRE
jgi:aryl-alcohol dehydrogenase-like predicted oxidoreductase